MKNYFSKILLALSISRNFSFLKLLINSKRYSRLFKKGVTEINDETVKYDFIFNRQNLELSMRTFKGDIDVFYEIFWQKAYHIPEKYNLKPKTIVDLGAHVGFTSVYYHLNYPEAQIFSVEASKKNYSLLTRNTQNLQNIKIFNAAVFSEDGFVNFDDDAALSYNTKIGKQGGLVEALCMNTFMEKNNISQIDLLKMDIEGAESEVLTRNNQWLNKVSNIIIELHSPYKTEDLERDLSPFGFKIHPIGEVLELKNILLTKN
ncbi:FkbM family methyltransferase [Chryseobacterium sp. Leaf394]|uniref:FkbM family methyltransferase n=1 Tax=Chryseobacterium sp. Leaf394 TaxID=1736361 RepID=UPI0006FD38AD|nr:FkbM family methyltransferase [Chryseobacterium sp. Leaf394]KQS92698.1 hypothetical protein ASG21_09750 [Chryseobacterium sp. Leaf394]